ncbi:MAG: DNA polymerase III subunit gamma/tau [Planctomycetota bacterium]|jgi:DNA polymerase-3 subunit gamma/tau
MAYTALARRYRSQSFDGVVGQAPIAQTLANAIASDRLHHAYLFTGTRGVGKTSMARILARALNAPDTIEGCPKPPNAEFPELDVQQRMADAIMRGEDMNVVEIDGASNRGVDDARQLIANAGLAPTANARYKVYIIDEVHMLTREAFNALLKTMEEPPSHLKFILCTTEPHKVLPTIQSRCQRFDFRNIPTAQIVEHLRDVLAGEDVEAEDAVIFQIARLGNGSMRDALSLLDRVLASGENPLTNELLEHMLGVPDRQLVFDLAAAVADSNPAGALAHTDSLLKRGIALDQLLTVLIEHFRNLMLAAACGADSELLELDDASRKAAVDQAAKFDTPALIHIIAMLENVQRNAKISSTPRALLDAAMARIAMSEKVADIAALLANQKKKLTLPGASAPAPPVTPAASSASPPAAAPAQPAFEPRPAAPGPQPQINTNPTAPPAPSGPPRFGNRAAGDAAPATSNTPKTPPVTQEDRDAAMQQPLVRQVVELFDARLITLRKQGKQPPAKDAEGTKDD